MSILSTSDNHVECNTTTHLRKGGFLGAFTRNCEEDLSASAISSDGKSDYLDFDDIDDFDGKEVNVTIGVKTKFKIYTQVRYLNDNVFTTSGNTMTIVLDNTTRATTSNIKKFKAIIGYVGGRGKDKNISSFSYYSTNIGQITLNSEAW